MRRLLLSLLTVVLSVTLCVNFVRFVFFTSSSNSTNNEFTDIDVLTVFDTFEDVDFGGQEMFGEILDTVDTLGRAGRTFVSAFQRSTYVDEDNIFTKIYSFISAIFGSIVCVIEFVAALINTAISWFVWMYNVLKVIYRFMNRLFGTAFGS